MVAHPICTSLNKRHQERRLVRALVSDITIFQRTNIIARIRTLILSGYGMSLDRIRLEYLFAEGFRGTARSMENEKNHEHHTIYQLKTDGRLLKSPAMQACSVIFPRVFRCRSRLPI